MSNLTRYILNFNRTIMRTVSTFVLAFLLTLTFTSLIAQQKQFLQHPAKDLKISHLDRQALHRSALENVFYPTVDDTCSFSLFLFFVNGGWGTVSGNNAFGDLEKAQRLTFTGSAVYTINSLFAFFGEASAVGDGMVTMKAYAVDEATEGPGQLLGTTESMLVSEIIIPPPDSGINMTTFDMPEPVSGMGESFFASVDLEMLYATSDTLSIWQTDQECGSGTDTWEQFSNGSWFSIIDQMSWQLNSDFLLGAIVEFEDSMSTSTDVFVKSEGLRLYPPSPNPAKDWIQLDFGLEDASEVSFEVYSLKGELLMTIDGGYKSSGRHQQIVPIHGLSSGSYIYRIMTGGNHILSKFLKE